MVESTRWTRLGSLLVLTACVLFAVRALPSGRPRDAGAVWRGRGLSRLAIAPDRGEGVAYLIGERALLRMSVPARGYLHLYEAPAHAALRVFANRRVPAGPLEEPFQVSGPPGTDRLLLALTRDELTRTPVVARSLEDVTADLTAAARVHGTPCVMTRGTLQVRADRNPRAASP